MRRQLRRVLQESDRNKLATSASILGYSPADLKNHLESKFLPGMSWEARSLWHIDHIKPISAFIAEGITDPKIINALTNLQPLWAKDNLAKGAKR